MTSDLPTLRLTPTAGHGIAEPTRPVRRVRVTADWFAEYNAGVRRAVTVNRLRRDTERGRDRYIRSLDLADERRQSP